MNKMKNKEGNGAISPALWILLAIIFLFILTNIGSRLLGKSGAEASDLLSSTGDIDGDDVANAFDKCLCLRGSIENDGCPSDIRTEELKRKNKCTKCEEDYDIKNCR